MPRWVRVMHRGLLSLRGSDRMRTGAVGIQRPNFENERLGIFDTAAAHVTFGYDIAVSLREAFERVGSRAGQTWRTDTAGGFRLPATGRATCATTPTSAKICVDRQKRSRRKPASGSFGERYLNTPDHWHSRRGDNRCRITIPMRHPTRKNGSCWTNRSASAWCPQGKGHRWLWFMKPIRTDVLATRRCLL